MELCPRTLDIGLCLALAGFFWNDLLDEEDDTDGDGWPDDVFALL